MSLRAQAFGRGTCAEPAEATSRNYEYSILGEGFLTEGDCHGTFHFWLRTPRQNSRNDTWSSWGLQRQVLALLAKTRPKRGPGYRHPEERSDEGAWLAGSTSTGSVDEDMLPELVEGSEERAWNESPGETLHFVQSDGERDSSRPAGVQNDEGRVRIFAGVAEGKEEKRSEGSMEEPDE